MAESRRAGTYEVFADALHRFPKRMRVILMEYLTFGTQHELGLEKMKDAMWKVDPSYGVRYRDPRDTQQQTLDLVFEPDTAPLRRILRDFISEAPDGRTIPELKRYASWKPSTGPPK
ncbi:hypothetical protein [Streptomyces sp. ATCC 21386]|uniref:hypothetical protein n=1 Tax=Streptomyces sp. ATCC 21386 TaxID=2699428 RepID=UPI002044DF00|nr:hypothetical protein [Streptomyces sp. ATCC 21386]